MDTSVITELRINTVELLFQFNSGDALVTPGTVPVTLVSKVREVVSVRDFGAIGDGVTNDTAAFQAAVDATANVRWLHIPGGTYMLNEVNLPASGHIFWYGDGMGTTVIKKRVGQGVGNFISTGVRLTSTDYLTFQDITFDGQVQLCGQNAANGALVHGYILSNWRFIRCEFMNSQGYGVGLQGKPDGTAGKTGPQTDIYFESCRFIYCGVGKRTENSPLAADIDSSVTSLTVADGSVFDQTGGTIQIDNEIINHGAVVGNVLGGLKRGLIGTTAAAHVAGTQVIRLTNGDGIDVKSSERLTFVECYAKNNPDKGFNPRSKFVRFVACTAEQCGSGFGLNSAAVIAEDPDVLIRTTLNGAITSSDVTINIASSTGFPSTGWARVDSEEVSYSGVAGNSLTGVTRGINGTTATSHNNGTGIGYFNNATAVTDSSQGHYDSCSAIGCYNSGFAANGNLTAPTYASFVNCHALNNGGNGIFIAGPSQNDTVPGGRITATISSGMCLSNGLSGVNVRSAYAYSVTGVTACFNTERGIEITTSPNGGTVSSNTLRGNTLQGLAITNALTQNVHASFNQASGNVAADQIRDFSANSNYFSMYRDFTVSNTYRFLENTATWDPPNLVDGDIASTTISFASVGEAAVGNLVIVSFNVALPAGAILTGAVTASNTVTVTLLNETGADLDLGSGTLRVIVIRPIAMT